MLLLVVLFKYNECDFEITFTCEKKRGLTFLDFGNWLLKTTVHMCIAIREMCYLTISMITS